MSAVGTAGGKVILLGEHSVVFGHPALAAALPYGVRMEAEHASGGVALVGAAVPDDPRVADAVARIAEIVGVSGATVRVESELPAGGGLGSSAAFAVALARALGSLSGGISDEQVAQAALASELVFHGRPSGVDHTACAREGMILFRRGEPPDVRAIVPARPLTLVVGLTGRSRSTGEKIASLQARVEQAPQRWLPVVKRLGALAVEGARAVETGSLASLGEMMDEAHRWLVQCELSCVELDEIVHAAKEAGALGAKLTGAGGGGAAIALVEDPTPVAEAIRRAGFEARTAVLGASR